jgi:hypothetical protein
VGLYSSLEDKWYTTLDKIDSIVPVYKIVDPIDKIVPSFILFLIIIFFILFFLGFSFFQIGNDNSIDIIIISETGIPLSDVKISLIDDCGESIASTDGDGKTIATICGGEIILNASKKGYVSFNQVYVKEDYETSGRIAIKLSQITQSEKDFTALVVDEKNDLITSSKTELICSGETKAELVNQSVDGFVFKIGQNTLNNILDLYGQFITGSAVSDCSNLQLRASADGYEDKIINVLDSDQRVVIKLKTLIQKGTITFNSKLDNVDVGNVEINLKNSSGEIIVFETDSSGVYFDEFDVGTYEYSANYDGEFKGDTIVLENSGSKEINLLFTTQLPSTNDKFVNLHFVDSLDQGIVGASVSIFKNDFKISKTTNILGQTNSLKVRESEITNTVFKGVVKASGYETKLFDIVLQESTTYQKIVLSQGGGKLIVTVIDDLNNVEKNAFVQLFLKDTNYLIDNARTDSNGQVIFTNLSSGQMDLLAEDYSRNDSQEVNVMLSKDEEKELLVQLDTGEGKIEFSIVDKEGNLLFANYKLFVKVNDEFVSAKEGFGNKVLTDDLKVKTQVKLLVDDENYFAHESLVYKINRGTQKKSVFVMQQNALPNENNVQMFLTQVYKTNPRYDSVNVADRFVDGEEYYLHFLIVLDSVVADKLVSNFVVDSNQEIYFDGTNLIDGAYSVMVANDFGRFIDSASDVLVDDHGKQLNTFVGASEKISVPVVVKLSIDENVSGSFKIKFNSFVGENSLGYVKEFVVGEKFCLQGKNCPVFMFSNFIKNKISGEIKPLHDRQVVFIEDEYSLLTKVNNLSDVDFGAANVVFSIPASKLRYAAFANDTNSQKRSIVLRPFNESDFVESDLELKQNTTGLLINELVEALSGSDLFRNYAGNNESINLSIRNKNILAIDFSPGRIDVDSVYPMFLIKTRFNSSSSGVSAFWKAEKVVGSVKTLLYSGETDGNGLSQTSFSALNLDVGDVVLFTAWDSNGSIEGIKQVVVTDPFSSQVLVASSCLSVWYDNSKIVLDNFVVSSDVGGVKSFVIKSDCERSVHVSFFSELSLSALRYDINAGGQVTLSITATPQNNILGVYPIEIFSNESGVTKLMNVDFIVKDPTSCFDLEQAIYDLKNVGELSSKVTNKCYTGRYDNFYPKMNINTNSVYINFNKPGNPRVINFKAKVTGHALESIVYGFVKSFAMEVREEKGDSDNPWNVPLVATAAKQMDAVMDFCEDLVYDGESTPKPEPELPAGKISTTPQEKKEDKISFAESVTPVGSAENITGGIEAAAGDTGILVRAQAYPEYHEYFEAYLAGLCETPNNNFGSPSAKVNCGAFHPNGYFMRYVFSDAITDIYGNRIPWVPQVPEYNGEYIGFNGKAERSYTVLSAHSDKHARITQAEYWGEDLVFMEYYVHGDIDKHWTGWDRKTSTIQAQVDSAGAVEWIGEQTATWEIDTKIIPIEGTVYPIGSYADATPLPKWDDVDTAFGYDVGDSFVPEGSQALITVACVIPNHFVNPEREVLSGTPVWAIKSASDPLVEYGDSGNIMYQIPKESIPKDLKVYLRDGKYYAEYVGVPQIAGNNIDFNLVKNNLVGDEYVILEVSDWISDKETRTQKFRVKLSGQENLCVNDDGEEGYTGSDFVPRIDYDWSWQNIAVDECDSTNWQYNYCDGTQFTISLIKKLNEIENLLKAGHVTSVPAKTAFYVYLIKDNYNQSFLDDFRAYYLDSFATTETNYQKFFKFIEENKIKFSVDRKEETMLPYGGLFRVEIDLGQGNELLSSLFDGDELNANIVVVLTSVRMAPNYNAFYEMPFDGLIGNNVRDGYGLSLTGQDLVVKTGFVPLDYVGALSNFEVLTSTSPVELNKKLVLAINKETNKIYFFPSQPTPVLMEITNNSFSNLVSGFKIENINGDNDFSKDWTLIGSTMGGRVCNDFSGKSKTIFSDTSVGGNINNLSWADPDIGKILLATNFFTQKDSGTTTITPTKVTNTKIKSFAYLNNSPKAFLNNYVASGVTDFDTLSWVLNGITTEKMCLSKDSNELLKVWWNQEYLNSLIDDVSKSEKTNCFNN